MRPMWSKAGLRTCRVKPSAGARRLLVSASIPGRIGRNASPIDRITWAMEHSAFVAEKTRERGGGSKPGEEGPRRRDQGAALRLDQRRQGGRLGDQQPVVFAVAT